MSFFHNERIALVGNATAERMNIFGNFETMLHLAYPKEQLVVRKDTDGDDKADLVVDVMDG